MVCKWFGMAGKAEHSFQCLDFLVKFSQWYCYFSELAKCLYICKAKDEALASQESENNCGLVIEYSRGKGIWEASLEMPG